jgi:hypothetical protein
MVRVPRKKEKTTGTDKKMQEWFFCVTCGEFLFLSGTIVMYMLTDIHLDQFKSQTNFEGSEGTPTFDRVPKKNDKKCLWTVHREKFFWER